MAAHAQRVTIVSLDGLSLAQFEQLQNSMPSLSKMLKQLKFSELDSRPFSASQPIWAELLTGEPWYRNGCVGYAQPSHSLNKLSVTTQKDLITPLASLFRLAPGVAINVPLLLPNESMTWLSDGSMPIQYYVAPRSLAEQEPFSHYVARGFKYLPVASAMSRRAIAYCFEVEKTRLECAVSLAQKDEWRWVLLRLSIFDELAHLFGDSWLTDRDLWFRPELETFLQTVDQALHKICKGSNCFIMSAYSHTPCTYALNLNIILRKGGFLRSYRDKDLLSPSRAEAKRADAIKAITGQKPRKGNLQTLEGLIVAEETTAASPVLGCVYINDRDRFSDGCVAESKISEVKRSVHGYLAGELNSLCHAGVHLHEPPAIEGGGNGTLIVPDFIVYAPNVEFNDHPSLVTAHEKPRSVHAPVGFVWGPGESLPESSTVTASRLFRSIGA